jgi:hypothetical protein
MKLLPILVEIFVSSCPGCLWAVEKMILNLCKHSLISDTSFITIYVLYYCRLQIRPLKYFVDFVTFTWDFQKKDLAAENYGQLKQIAFIPPPDTVNYPYSTPGMGNICDDGVHPSTQGCNTHSFIYLCRW